jgi:hypothetical protein
MADARALSEQVFYICAAWATIYISVELRLREFLDAHPQVNVNQYRGYRGQQVHQGAAMLPACACC